MGDVEEREVGNRMQATTMLLIATQGSKFKHEFAEKVIHHFQSPETYIKVIDVKAPDAIDESHWDAIFINHTWEMYKVPKSVEVFVDNIKDRGKLVLFGTSQDGTLSLDNIDAMSGASEMSEVSAKSQEIVDRLHNIMQ